MQALVFARAAPVAPVQRVGIAEVQRAGNGLATRVLRQREQHLGAQPRRHIHKKLPRQIAAVTGAFGVGHLVEAVKDRPVVRGQFAPVAQAEGKSLFLHTPPLPAQRLAFAADQSVEKIVEVAIAPVVPVKLHLPAGVHSGGLQPGVVRRVGKQHVPGGNTQLSGQRGHLFVKPQPQLGGIEPGFVEQARPRRRRKGNGRDQLGVVGQAHAPPGVRPGPIEDVFTVGMTLEIGGKNGQRAPAIAQAQMGRRPARGPGGALRLLQTEQKIAAQKGVVIRPQPVPGGRVDGRHRTQYFDVQTHGRPGPISWAGRSWRRRRGRSRNPPRCCG